MNTTNWLIILLVCIILLTATTFFFRAYVEFMAHCDFKKDASATKKVTFM